MMPMKTYKEVLMIFATVEGYDPHYTMKHFRVEEVFPGANDKEWTDEVDEKIPLNYWRNR